MKISKNGINLIKQFEGCRLAAYKDSAGVPTIGYGHTAGVKMGQKITQAQADYYLLQDIASHEKAVDKYQSRYKWSQNEYDALVSFDFNTGKVDQLTAGGTRSRAVIAEKMLEYRKAAGVVNAGLLRRRQKERVLFLTPPASCTGATSGSSDAEVKKEESEEYLMKIIRKGSRGSAVKVWQIIVGATVDGVFGAGTESRTKSWQKKHGLVNDGIVGKKTWKVGLESL